MNLNKSTLEPVQLHMDTLEQIKSVATSLGIEAIGVAPWPLPKEASLHLQEEHPCPFTAGTLEERLSGNSRIQSPKSAIVCLFPYYTDTTDNTNLARYTWGQDYHLIVPQYLEKIIAHLQTKHPEYEYEIHCDTSPLADRYVAYQAGLGFFGRNQCLIHPTLGSFTVIGTILTDLPLPTNTPLTQSCLNCGHCIAACPGSALTEEGFSFTTCKSYLTQKKGDLSTEEEAIIAKTPLIFGCDICQNVCPHNQSLKSTPLPEFQQVEPWLAVEKLQDITNKEFKSQFGHRSFAWRGKKILLRNQHIIDKQNNSLP